jgi:hypothetical protein
LHTHTHTKTYTYIHTYTPYLHCNAVKANFIERPLPPVTDTLACTKAVSAATQAKQLSSQAHTRVHTQHTHTPDAALPAAIQTRRLATQAACHPSIHACMHK